MMELFVVGHENDPHKLWSFVNVDRAVLLEHWRYKWKLRLAFPFIRMRQRGYRDAGQNQITLQASGRCAMEDLLADEGISEAAAALSLRVMRKRATIYGKNHCTQLANNVLDYQGDPADLTQGDYAQGSGGEPTGDEGALRTAQRQEISRYGWRQGIRLVGGMDRPGTYVHLLGSPVS